MGTKLPSGRVWQPSTRKSCVCCGRNRLPDETFSKTGQCSDCSTANLVAALLGQKVSEHWIEGKSGERINHHEVLISDLE